jgi:hypothetical protein
MSYGQLRLRCCASPEHLDVVTFDLFTGMSLDNVSEPSQAPFGECERVKGFAGHRGVKM